MERYLQLRLGSRKFAGVSDVRSRTMSAVRSRGNRSTEMVLRMAMVQRGIRGWVMHDRSVPGTPDFFFPKRKVAVFVDGCFWHACPKCGTTPKTRTAFWVAKFERNKERDQRNKRLLRKQGITVVRVWEHQLVSLAQRRGIVDSITSTLRATKRLSKNTHLASE